MYHGYISALCVGINSSKELDKEKNDGMDKHKKDYPEKAIKDQIWNIVRNRLPEKLYQLDHYAQEHGDCVVRLPPYHCHFNSK